MIRESMIVIKSRFFEDLGLIQISFYSFIYFFFADSLDLWYNLYKFDSVWAHRNHFWEDLVKTLFIPEIG